MTMECLGKLGILEATNTLYWYIIHHTRKRRNQNDSFLKLLEKIRKLDIDSTLLSIQTLKFNCFPLEKLLIALEPRAYYLYGRKFCKQK